MISNDEIKYRLNKLESYISEFQQFKNMVRNDIIPQLQSLNITTQDIKQDLQQLPQLQNQITKLTNDINSLLGDVEND